MLNIGINLCNSNSVVANNLFLNPSITNEELVIYCLLQRNYFTIKGFGICSIIMLCDYLYIQHNNSRVIDTIRKSIIGLIKKEYIAIRDKNFNEVDFGDIDNKTNFYVGFDLPESEFFQIYDSALDNLFESIPKIQSNISKFKIARLYIACLRVISNQSEFGYISQSSCKKCGFASDTISKYFKILQDLGLILYNNDYLTPEKHYTKTYVGNPDNKKNFEFQLGEEISKFNLIHTDKKISNKRRSVSKKIDNTKKKIDTAKDNEIAKLKEMLAKTEAEKKELEFKINEKKSKPKKHLGLNKPEPIIEEVQPIEEDLGSEEDIPDEDITKAIDNCIADNNLDDDDYDIFGDYFEHEKMQEQKDKDNNDRKNELIHKMFPEYPLNAIIPDDDNLDF
ncbi:hypothetical protein [Clostridium pasteurianum]|uniref:Uncharacterized protein n=1 Tax=Clostridium pasteurianum BC1 TaxID=86416 RepID=R4K8C0_CLOPA|nr:hypothetical protein [Clostridium pasteurianum]AGK96774.1 hypothetical protein Clopa_1874 [Clostridium pasteurianum BC1]